jgi:hypothetical protein
MNRRSKELAQRRRMLQARCAMQRSHLAETAEQLEAQLGGIDRGVNMIRGLVRSPLLIAGGIALFALVGPRRIVSWIARTAMFATTLRRVRRLIH